MLDALRARSSGRGLLLAHKEVGAARELSIRDPEFLLSCRRGVASSNRLRAMPVGRRHPATADGVLACI